MPIYYIRTDGNDSNDGLSNAAGGSPGFNGAFRTIGKFVRNTGTFVAAGDTCMVVNGQFDETPHNWVTGGTAGNPVTLQAVTPAVSYAEVSGVPTWTLVGAGSRSIWATANPGTNPQVALDTPYNASYVVIDGIYSQTSGTATYQNSSAGDFVRSYDTGTNTHITVQYCYVEDTGSSRDVSMKLASDYVLIQYCMLMQGLELFKANASETSIEVKYNYVTGLDDWGDCVTSKGGIHNVSFHHNKFRVPSTAARGVVLGGNTADIYLYGGAPNPEFYNGLFFNNTIIDERTSSGTGYGRGLTLCGTQDTGVYNNTLINAAIQMMGGDEAANFYPINTTLKNNIMVSTYAQAGKVAFGSASGTVTDHNCWYGSWNDTPSSGETGSITTDPLFVNQGGEDYHLQSGSPCRDVGVTVGSVTTDQSNVARPQGSAYDMGAYEYVTSGSGSNLAIFRT